MATPSEKLADALEALHENASFKTASLRKLSRDETRGESTAWYASFWQFCAAYLNHLKSDERIKVRIITNVLSTA